jgi:tRNA A-37 threonylcarbamoyl transferase component Bud32
MRTIGVGFVCTWFAGLLTLAVVVVGIIGALHARRKARSLPQAKSPMVPGNARRSGPLPARPPSPEAQAGRCPVCAAELPEDCPMGLCPECLLEGAMSQPQRVAAPGHPGGTAAYQGASAAPAVADLAALFPQLEITEFIGQGGMGAVYKARQIKLDRTVAVKILPAEWGRDPAFAERFAREARALARLSHPHIVAVHDFGETGGLFYLVMEFVDGANLRQLLECGRLQPEQALQIVPQVCEALQYAHEEDIVHRDIKPENILLDRRGQVKIADFGLAKLMRPSAAEFTLTGTRQVMGTLNYMSPEQRTRPQDVDHRADIYSLGVVFYEMLTGQLPLGRFAPPSDTGAVDQRLDEVVFHALEQDPAKRYQRVSEIKMDVEAIAGMAPQHVPSGSARIKAPSDLSEEIIRLRMTLPAAGLVVTALTILFQAIVLAGMGIIETYRFFAPPHYSTMPEEVFWFFFAAGALVVILVLGIMIRGAFSMMRLENHGLVMVAVILALLPFSYHVVIGWPVAGWCLWVLSRAEVREAFARNVYRSRRQRPPSGGVASRMRSALGGMLTLLVHRPTAAPASHNASHQAADAGSPQQRSTPAPRARLTNTDDAGHADAAPGSKRLLSPAVPISIGVLIVAVVFVVYLVASSSWQSARIDRRAASQIRTISADDTPLAFHRGSLSTVGLGDQQDQQLGDVLRAADQDYLKLEGRNTRVAMDGDKRIVTIAPFKQEVDTIEARVRSQINTLMLRQPYQIQERVLKLLALHGPYFPFGQEKVQILLQRTDDGFAWGLISNEAQGEPLLNHGPRLPKEYERFWPEAAKE